MALPTIFANLAAGNQNLSLFDTMFNAVAALVATSCTCTGTNALVLTPLANAPTPSLAQAGYMIQFTAQNNNTGAVTIAVGSLSALNAYKGSSAGPTSLVANDLAAGVRYIALYDPALNGGLGGFMVTGSPIGLSVTGPATWTPADASGAGLTLVNAGSYFVQQGKVVTLQAKITWPANASGANAAIGGLPATPYASVPTVGFQGVGTFFGSEGLNPAINSSGNLNLYVCTTGNQITNSSLNSSTIAFTMSYFTA